MRRYTCGVPKEQCSGSLDLTINIPSLSKVHSSPKEAFACHARWLTRQGYKQIGSREFDLGDGSPVRVLTKKSRFGGVLRGGKRGQIAKTKRLVPRHEALSGVVSSY